MTTDREAFLASFKEYLATTPAVELLNDYTYLLIYINHDPYDEQERYQYLVDAVSTVGTKFSQVDTWRAGCAKRQREDDNAFWESAMAWHDHHYAKAPEPYCLSDVPCEETEWLVPDVLPRGEISLLGADGGTGKGIWQAQLIAYVTAGRTSGFFPQPPEKTGSVLIFSGEDDPGKVLKARLTAAGADMSRVMVVTSDAYFARTGSPLCIPDTSFAKYVGKAAPALVIIDPLQSFLPAGVEMASRNQMRSALLPLKALCAKHGCAALISMHTNKRANVSGRARLADSSDIWDIARSVLMMGRDKNSEKLYLSHEKSSYSAPARTALLHIEQAQVEGVKTAVAVFDSRTDKKDADFVEERRVRTAQTKEDTAQTILDILSESKTASMGSEELRAEVLKQTNCSSRTFDYARAELKRAGKIKNVKLREKDGRNKNYTLLAYCGETACGVGNI